MRVVSHDAPHGVEDFRVWVILVDGRHPSHVRRENEETLVDHFLRV